MWQRSGLAECLACVFVELLEVLAAHGITVPVKSSDPRIDYPIEEGTGEEEEEEIVEEEVVVGDVA